MEQQIELLFRVKTAEIEIEAVMMNESLVVKFVTIYLSHTVKLWCTLYRPPPQ